MWCCHDGGGAVGMEKERRLGGGDFVEGGSKE